MKNVKRTVADMDINSILRKCYNFYSSAWTAATSRYPLGTNIYEKEWDAVLILDTARVDALHEVAPEFDFLTNVGSIVSVGSTSSEWLANTFRKEYCDEIAQTAHVTANSHAKRVLVRGIYPDPQFQGRFDRTAHNMVSEDDFLILDQPWEYIDYEGVGHTPPKYITDRAIAVARELSPKRLVVHYSQPHAPYSAQAIAEGREQYAYEQDPFDALQRGTPLENVWDSYLDELRRVLESVELLLKNLDANQVVISADHGEAFGEWGLYGHYQGMPHPHVKRVPWAITTASDSETYEPTVEPQDTATQTVEEQLKALGYAE